MGWRKKGECSRDAILKQVDLASKEKVGMTKTEKSKKVKVVEVQVEDLDQKKESQISQPKLKSPVAAENSFGIEDNDDEVFNEDNVEYEDDIMELTRLMSLCDVKENVDEYEEQLNMAGI